MSDNLGWVGQTIKNICRFRWTRLAKRLKSLSNEFPTASVQFLRSNRGAAEEGREGHKPLAKIDDLPLFGATAPKPKTSAVEEALKTIEPDALSPKEALELLYDLKWKLLS